MKKFAKLFEDEELGQILVFAEREGDDGKASLTFYVDPNLPTHDVCKARVSWNSDEKNSAFDSLEVIEKKGAVNMARMMLRQIDGDEETKNERTE